MKYYKKTSIIILYSWKIVCNTKIYIIFQCGWKPILIQRILIGFKAMLEIYLIDLFRWTLFYKSNSASISWSSDRRVAENVRALRRGKDSPFSVKSMSSAVIFAASAAGPRMSGELRPLDSSSLFGGGLVFLCFNTCKV